MHVREDFHGSKAAPVATLFTLVAGSGLYEEKMNPSKSALVPVYSRVFK